MPTTETEYAHLVGTSSGGAEIATCLYFDGLNANVSTDALLNLAEQWFIQNGFHPRVLLVKDADDKRLPRPSIRTLRQYASGRKAIEVIETLEIFPKGRTTIEDTWMPAIYFAVSIERPTAAFLSVNSPLTAGLALELLQRGDGAVGARASYAFTFPARFSPSGYFWGISVQPAGRDVGKWGDRESHRLSHWRDNTSIGIGGDGGRRWYGPDAGYVRDAYPIMLLSDAHAERAVGAIPLREVIEQRAIGSIQRAADKLVWSIPRGKLREAQILLDENDISLSGRRLEWSKKVPH